MGLWGSIKDAAGDAAGAVKNAVGAVGSGVKRTGQAAWGVASKADDFAAGAWDVAGDAWRGGGNLPTKGVRNFLVRPLDELGDIGANAAEDIRDASKPVGEIPYWLTAGLPGTGANVGQGVGNTAQFAGQGVGQGLEGLLGGTGRGAGLGLEGLLGGTGRGLGEGLEGAGGGLGGGLTSLVLPLGLFLVLAVLAIVILSQTNVIGGSS